MARNRNATAYLAAVLVSSFGTSAMMLAAGIWVMSLTGSSSLAAWVGFLLWSPTLAGPVLGAIVDRAPDRRRVMIGTHVAMGLLLLLLVTVDDRTDVWLIFAVMVAYGVGFVVSDAAETAVLPAAIAADLLGDVNGLRMSASEGMKLAAPLIGAGLFTWFGGASVAVLDAVTFFAAAVLCLLLRPGPIVHTSETTAWRQRTAEGVRVLWKHRELRRIVFSATAVMAVGGLAGTTIYAVVDEGLHRTPAFVGVLSAVQGAGSVIGGLLAGPLQRRFRPHVFVGAAIAVFAAGAVLRAVPSLPVVAVSSVLIGVTLPWVLIAVATRVQSDIPAAYLGRVSGTVALLTFAPGAVGQATGASLLALTDYRLILAAGATVAAVTAALCLRPLHSPESPRDETTATPNLPHHDETPRPPATAAPDWACGDESSRDGVPTAPDSSPIHREESSLDRVRAESRQPPQARDR
ncbi:MFS transporter [Actinoplanes philippinensis]|uniref:MFS-type transporter involved in bile tolerance, Atg22 family n=1 Tax=Actinoplanes philippinensis TaxID=35752 RepID=A0A1I2E752_9ACTN|nr:MFS transporter [Actinoplanes philippinensis]SFE88772.1 MFS-type transporter involved in bile tolerance, Atg22 family [Actinoplanes philippinensis]